MRINTGNNPGVRVKRNFKISLNEAAGISRKTNSYLKKNKESILTTPSGVYAVNLIGQITEYIFLNYLLKENPEIFLKTEKYAEKQLGRKQAEKVIELFQTRFSPCNNPVEELLVLRLTNENPACAPYKPLFDEAELADNTSYLEMMALCFKFLQDIPGPGGETNIIDFLKEPVRAHPDSLLDQLQFMAENWKSLLGDWFLQLLRGIDYLKEENKAVFPPGPGPAEVYTYNDSGDSPEGFSTDSHWMPNVVMMAKSTLVWLDQLSKQYNRSIKRLDQIPDRELDILAARGFSTLWLIGLWERSSASKQIKRSCGNPEAESSAYSLKQYEIAMELGGWESLNDLKTRCEQRGIRLASDMVPNHTGIDSDWINEHPDWFIQLPSSPYPNYSYTGQNLSSRQDIGIYIEDHYYDQTDAAVTFKRVDFNSGRESYIYHGNDGTAMPWNDTAQLDYLNPETREAIIQTILHVASNFPVIRFDAAMTLAKKHIQRLWYPEPGMGGDIPTRSERGMTRKDFDKAIPVEFWREVVERIQQEAPDTLLLAEAFWMMEGYFVRNLGMHRVYNSAFMNMLKMEENEKYRNTIKNTLNFDPEILKRFVNFMNNPDEESAAEQFGTGDKYFGICTMLSTMPGLPMFGHGQIEGYREKYGMEYRKAYYNETPDPGFVSRHEREIFPLLKKRYLFSESENFNLYDLSDHRGEINENIFAWSNKWNEECSLIFFNNSFSHGSGTIKTAAPKSDHPDSSLASELGLHSNPEYFTIFTEQKSNLTYIRNSRDIHEKGLFINLEGYACQVFLDFREVKDSTGDWKRVEADLKGRGVPDIDLEWEKIILRPAKIQLSKIFTLSITRRISKFITEQNGGESTLPDELIRLYHLFILELVGVDKLSRDEAVRAESLFKDKLDALSTLKKLYFSREKGNCHFLEYIFRGFGMMPEVWVMITVLLTIPPLTKQGGGTEYGGTPLFTDILTFLDSLDISAIVEPLLKKTGIESSDFFIISRLIQLISAFRTVEPESLRLRELLDNTVISEFIGINKHRNIEWFNGESFQLFSWWVFTMEALKFISKDVDSDKINTTFTIIRQWLKNAEDSEYQLNRLLAGQRKP